MINKNKFEKISLYRVVIIFILKKYICYEMLEYQPNEETNMKLINFFQAKFSKPLESFSTLQCKIGRSSFYRIDQPVKILLFFIVIFYFPNKEMTKKFYFLFFLIQISA